MTEDSLNEDLRRVHFHPFSLKRVACSRLQVRRENEGQKRVGAGERPRIFLEQAMKRGVGVSSIYKLLTRSPRETGKRSG